MLFRWWLKISLKSSHWLLTTVSDLPLSNRLVFNSDCSEWCFLKSWTFYNPDGLILAFKSASSFCFFWTSSTLRDRFFILNWNKCTFSSNKANIIWSSSCLSTWGAILSNQWIFWEEHHISILSFWILPYWSLFLTDLDGQKCWMIEMGYGWLLKELDRYCMHQYRSLLKDWGNFCMQLKDQYSWLLEE